MKLKYSFVVHEVADTKVAVAVGSDHEKFNGMVKLGGTGEFIFSMLSAGDVTIDEIVTALTERYDVTKETATECVQKFVQTLRDRGLIIE